mgnify:FL=1
MDNDLIVYTAVPVDDAEKLRLQEFFKDKYGAGSVAFGVKPDLIGGMRLVFRDRIEDYSLAGRLGSLKQRISSGEKLSGGYLEEEGAGRLKAIKRRFILKRPGLNSVDPKTGEPSHIKRKLANQGEKAADIIETPRRRLNALSFQPVKNAIGRVISSSDGIVEVSDMAGVKMGELINFHSGAYGIAMNLEKDYIGVAVFSGDTGIESGEVPYGTGKIMEVPVGKGLLGRVVNPMGIPIDGRGEIISSGHMPIEAPAPGIIERGPVNRPMQTGILSIDAMTPIGRGQRELIIGDRQIGKTAIAIDTILNQKDKDMVCIYVAIGQKASKVAEIEQLLRAKGAMDYTVIVCATASDNASMQYICPYAGCAIGEYFMYEGQDALIIYDDLSKHAVSYRTLSLLLRRPPGREAYPGDVFYLHSRLLERAAQLNESKGGGSLTALPIIETMAGDISAYIPTNVISITDGQIFLDSELFRSGVRPAVNVGLSVSRVGGAAQGRAVRKVSGRMRLDLAQYRELKVFAQFGSDLDASTRASLNRGEQLTEALKQGQYSPYSYADEAIILNILSEDLCPQVPPEQINRFLRLVLDNLMLSHPEVIFSIEHDDVISEDCHKTIISVINELLAAPEE